MPARYTRYNMHTPQQIQLTGGKYLHRFTSKQSFTEHLLSSPQHPYLYTYTYSHTQTHSERGEKREIKEGFKQDILKIVRKLHKI